MKDYLNSQEIWDMIKIGKLADEIDGIVDAWKKRGNLTKDEHKWLKMSLSFALKAYTAVLLRIQHSSLDAMQKRRKSMAIYYLDKFMEKKVESQMASNITDMQKDERYYDLAECAVFYLCGNCTKHSHTCYMYAHFVIHALPEPSGEDYENKHCRYGHMVNKEKYDRMEVAVKELVENINEKNGTNY